MRRLRLYARLARLAAVVAIGLILASGLRLQAVIGKSPRHAARHWLCRWWLARLAAALPYKVHLTGVQPSRTALWLSNHQSWADIPLLGMLQPMAFLSKSELRHWPLLGWLAAEAGTLFIKRGSGDSGMLNQQLGEELRQGRSLLIFPEGTTTNGAALRTFHSRLLACAIETGMPIQPVAIRYLRNGELDPISPFIGDDDLLSHLIRLLGADHAAVEIQLLQPIDSRGMERNRLGRACHAAISEALYGPVPVREAA
ncbi:1-acyl-sn-glycerol-3-phosphate acyltransferase [Stutzerimonas zhaodongensis]|uniref:1-acyl-sn-glycerol-3-phosphate acyltransferase n=1 Tax=Stutzerimonas zhaodongensis TaxID=1176257 RepID=A0A3M2HTS7_9GAMM|nr:lysophospholipid acyltransferase family protein [Stutzerimonas zhaodongensis]MCQ4315117.1 1-acyl-sn-glycerol-3-phosphate acyltransferase [Stutzerimonas zhaodongensis]RMH90302.1 1-acyl-sn-glycerol-3-phosphate acyltransferase [Stutzerimonas zhaodongensis]